MKKLNLGCRTELRVGWVNSDKEPYPNTVFCDFDKKFPFKDNEFEEVLLKYSLEHAKNCLFTLKEVRRVCKNGAIVRIVVLHCSLVTAMANLEHFQEFGWDTLNFLEKRNLFVVEDRDYTQMVFPFTRWFANIFPGMYEKFVSHLLPVRDIYYELRVIK